MPSSSMLLEERVDLLEKELRSIKKMLTKNGGVAWWQQISGTFADDPIFTEIDALGQKIRRKQPRKSAS